MSRLLVTGGVGYIGSHTAITLSEMGYEVVLYDNLSNSSHDVVEKIRQLSGMSIPFVHGDLLDGQCLAKTLKAHNVAGVIHFAGLKSVGESSERPIDYYSNNVQGTISLLHAMEAQQIRTLVFSSSATVYGQPKYLPIDESHPTSATNPYGRSKIHIEEMLKDIASSRPDWRIACLRYFNPVGAHESGLIGDNPVGVPNNLMPYIAQVAGGLRQQLTVFGNDYPTKDGTGVRDYIHVMDLAEGHSAALKFISHTSGWHAFNLGTGQGYSVLEIIRAFEQETGCAVPYSITSRRVGDVSECFADPGKAARLLGWVAQRGLAEMCASSWRFCQSAGWGEFGSFRGAKKKQ